MPFGREFKGVGGNPDASQQIYAADENGVLRAVGADFKFPTDTPISADEGVNGKDVATFGPSTTHGYDTEKGAVRTMEFARRVSKLELMKAQPVGAGATVNSGENLEVEDFSKIRLFATTTPTGAGNIDVVLRVSINGGYNYTDVHTFSMGDGGKTVLSPIVELGATHFKIALVNKSASAQNIDVWGLLF